MEYPKRLYRGGKGYTVNNLEEEQAFLGGPAEGELPLPASTSPELVEEEHEVDPSEQKEEALQYIVSLGYSKTEAKKVLKNEGVEKVLEAKAAGKDPQE